MSKIHLKSRSFLLAQCTTPGQIFYCYRLPVNAFYGYDEQGEFVYLSLQSDYIKFGWNRQEIETLPPIFVVRRKPNAVLPACMEWVTEEVTENSTLYEEILYLFDKMSDVCDFSAKLEPHHAGRNENTKRWQGKDLHRHAPKLRKSVPTTKNIFLPGPGPRHVSVDAWNGNI